MLSSNKAEGINPPHGLSPRQQIGQGYYLLH